MINRYCRNKLAQLLETADIRIDGGRPWDIEVHKPVVFRRAITDGNLGLGESYMDGWWECRDLEEFFFRVLRAKADEKVMSGAMILQKIAGSLCNLQSPSRAYAVGEHHYNTGNNLFEKMLDKRMIYSCGYWKGAKNLDEAQENKLRLVFEKLKLQPGMSVLDIGCGWGGAAQFAAEQYGVTVTALTVSTQQAALARERCAGWPVTVSLSDYRRVKGSFDRIYSLGMFEHVGYKNYREYFNTVRNCLKPDGMTLLHTIGTNEPSTNGDPWSCKYIFPNSMLPAASQIAGNYEGLFTLEDWHVFSYDYTLTLREWLKNFENHWPELRSEYSEKFYRMWRYYLMSFAGSFRARSIQLWQILLSTNGILGKVEIPR
ncbi:MAG: cyclopropane fatty acyl phospholipid synthase [Chlorobiaceae bacterium]